MPHLLAGAHGAHDFISCWLENSDLTRQFSPTTTDAHAPKSFSASLPCWEHLSSLTSSVRETVHDATQIMRAAKFRFFTFKTAVAYSINLPPLCDTLKRSRALCSGISFRIFLPAQQFLHGTASVAGQHPHEHVFSLDLLSQQTNKNPSPLPGNRLHRKIPTRCIRRYHCWRMGPVVSDSPIKTKKSAACTL